MWKPERLSKKRILVAPLNWGLGHASRCVPIIRELLKQKNEVILAADGSPLLLLRQEFPKLQWVELKGLNIQYPKRLPFAVYFALKMPQLLQAMSEEKRGIKKLVEQHKLDVIISDNRYGLVHEEVHSILITHQLFVKSPLFERNVQQFIHAKIQKFDECWVPDFEGEENLSGELSHAKSELENLKFIGPLSRFKKEEHPESYDWDLMVILSGPEPHRTAFEQKIRQQLQSIDLSVLVVKGQLREEVEQEHWKEEITVVSHLSAQQMQAEILKSRLVLCRAGYSSVMDLHCLQKRAILVPTEGQTEQEYLASYLHGRYNFYSVSEREMNLSEDLKRL